MLSGEWERSTGLRRPIKRMSLITSEICPYYFISLGALRKMKAMHTSNYKAEACWASPFCPSLQQSPPSTPWITIPLANVMPQNTERWTQTPATERAMLLLWLICCDERTSLCREPSPAQLSTVCKRPAGRDNQICHSLLLCGCHRPQRITSWGLDFKELKWHVPWALGLLNETKNLPRNAQLSSFERIHSFCYDDSWFQVHTWKVFTRPRYPY